MPLIEEDPTYVPRHLGPPHHHPTSGGLLYADQNTLYSKVSACWRWLPRSSL